MAFVTCNQLGQALISWLENCSSQEERDDLCDKLSCALDLHFGDTNSVKLLGDGTIGDPYRFYLNVDPNTNNSITVSSTGVLVLNAKLELNIHGHLIFTDNKGDTYDLGNFGVNWCDAISPTPNNLLECIDGKLAVRISRDLGNCIEWRNDGLYVRCCCDDPQPGCEGMMAAFTTGLSGSDVTVTDSSTPSTGNNLVSWDWSWGDGSANSSGQSPAAHTYATSGSYTVTLTVTDDKGCYAQISHMVEISEEGCDGISANFTFTVNDAQKSVSVAGTATPSQGNTIVSWDWDWGDSTAHGSGQNTSHVYNSTGSYWIKLTVTDSNGCVATRRKDVYIQTPNICDPDFDIVWLEQGKVEVQLNPASQALGFAQLNWKFGDGSPTVVKTSGYSLPETYHYVTVTSPGVTNYVTFTITLQYFDDPNVGICEKKHTVTYPQRLNPNDCLIQKVDNVEGDYYNRQTGQDRNPWIKLHDVDTDIDCLEVEFSADYCGSVSTTANSWLWDFGDNTATSSQQNPTHQYATDGTYTVTVTVKDTIRNVTDTQTFNVTVSSAGC